MSPRLGLQVTYWLPQQTLTPGCPQKMLSALLGPKHWPVSFGVPGRGSCSRPSPGLPLAHTDHHWLTAWVLPTSSQRLPPPQGHSLFPGGWEQGVCWGGRLSALRLGCWRYMNPEASFYGILGEGWDEGGGRVGCRGYLPTLRAGPIATLPDQYSFRYSLSTWVTDRHSCWGNDRCHVLRAQHARHGVALRAEIQRGPVRRQRTELPWWLVGCQKWSERGMRAGPGSGLTKSPPTGQRQFWCHSPASGCPLWPPRGGELAAASWRWEPHPGHRHRRPACSLCRRQRRLPLPEASRQVPP